MNKYCKNFILLGDLNHHCLVCKESFQTVDDLEKHLRWEKHRKSIKDLSPMQKFKRDRIFKIDDKYFCEHCNQVYSTISEVTKHLQDENHQKNKTNPEVDLKPTQCKRESGQIVIGNDKDIIKITNREWYGVIDAKCIFCDVAVDHFVKHISLSNHMITMIQSKIVQDEEGLFYREFKDKYGYCFLCKTTFEMASMSDHWNDELHTDKTKAHNEKNAKTDQEKKIDVAIKLINSQKDYFDIDLENKVATCKICTAYVNINFKFMIEHKKIHNITDKDKIEPVPVDMDEVYKSLKCKKSYKDSHDHGKLRAELAKFGREHGIKLIFPGGKGFCSFCGTYVSAHMKIFTDHIRGQTHMGHLELKGLDKSDKPHVKPVYKTKKMKDFIKTLTHHQELGMLLINKQYYVEIFSFMLITLINDPHGEKFKCHACDIIYDHKETKNHCVSEGHGKNLDNADFITTIPGELIREIRPNLYHCAICNLSFAFWETLDNHLRSWKHLVAKNDKDNMLSGRVSELALALEEEDELLATLLALGLGRNK